MASASSDRLSVSHRRMNSWRLSAQNYGTVLECTPGMRHGNFCDSTITVMPVASGLKHIYIRRSFGGFCMSHWVGSDSPLHEKICVAGATILGGAVGAVGTAGNPLGVLVGAGVGFIVGRYVCGRDSVSGWFKDKMDFSVQISALITNPDSHKVIVDGLVSAAIVKNASEASVLLRYIVQEVNRDPDKYFKLAEKQRSSRGPATGQARHGLFLLGKHAGGATSTADKS
jgi:hypothetical protein